MSGPCPSRLIRTLATVLCVGTSGLRSHLQARVVVIASMTACACWVSAAPQASPDMETLMARVGERVADYYRRARSVVWTELSTVHPIAWNMAPEGFSRTVESDLRVEFEAADGDALLDVTVTRDIRRINGRPPRERDKTDRTGCTDPSELSPEPLAFLLPAHRQEYRFTSVRNGKDKDRAALIVEFTSASRRSTVELIADERGHDDCFDWSGPLATRGRIWLDATTYDVLRVDRWMEGPVDVRVPWTLQRRHNLPMWIVIDRDDLTVRYKPVRFSDPDEVIVLPESVETLTVARSALQSTRSNETYSSYRRFLTSGRIVKSP